MKTGWAFFRKFLKDEAFAKSVFEETGHTFDHKKTIAAALKRGYKLTEEDMEKYTEGNAICVKGGGYRG